MKDIKAKNLHHKILKGHAELMKHHAALEKHISAGMHGKKAPLDMKKPGGKKSPSLMKGKK